MKKIFLGSFLMLISAVLNAQTIEIGAKVPLDKTFEIINYETSSIKLEDLKGKFVILDFWATWCGPCVSFFSKAEYLRAKFKNDLVILPVTSESRTVVSKFFQNYNQVSKNKIENLVSIVGDSLLHRVFPHLYIPHEVWVDRDGVVRAITDAENVNEQTITDFIASKQVKSKIKKDPEIISVFRDTVFSAHKNVEIRDDQKILHSIFTKYKPEFMAAQRFPSEEQIYRADNTSGLFATLYNSSILKFFQVSLGAGNADFMFDNRVRLDVEDSLLVTLPNSKMKEYKSWIIDHTYCYELEISDVAAAKKFYEIMYNDVSTYFSALGVTGKKIKEDRECWVLKKTGSVQSILSKGGNSFLSLNYLSVKMQNATITDFLSQFKVKMQSSPYPIIDESGISEPLDFDFVADMTDMTQVNAALDKLGLQFMLERRSIDVILVTQKLK